MTDLRSREMEVEVRLFATLRERAGRDRIALALSEGATVADALAAAAQEPGLGEVLTTMPVRVFGSPSLDRLKQTMRFSSHTGVALVKTIWGNGRP